MYAMTAFSGNLAPAFGYLAGGRTQESACTHALRLFDQVVRNPWRDCLRRLLPGAHAALLPLAGTRQGAELDRHYAGVQTVAIRSIRGSEGRLIDFDAEFRPLHDRTRDRWVSVAAARLRGTRLPPVELIKSGDDYFVRDGHHRISVARALGEEFIEANVTVW